MESIPRHDDRSHFSPAATFRRCVSWSDTARDAPRSWGLAIWHRGLSGVFPRDKFGRIGRSFLIAKILQRKNSGASPRLPLLRRRLAVTRNARRPL